MNDFGATSYNVMGSQLNAFHQPIFPSFHSKKVRHCCQHHHRQMMVANQKAILESARNYAPCIPQIATQITDEAAQSMLERVEYTPVTTNLFQSIINTSHVRTACKDSGKPALLFLHGFDSNLLEYRYMLPMVEDVPYDVHFLDILGWGFTERPVSTSFSYSPASKREHLRAFIEQVIKKKEIVLVGASLGAAVAIDFALQYPDLVSALVLVDGQAFTDKPKSIFLQLPGFAELGVQILRSRWLRSLAVQLSYESKELKCENTLRIGGLHCEGEGWQEAALDFVKQEGYCLSKRVGEIQCPVLVLWGENDRVLPKGDAQQFVEVISNCRLEYIRESGHCPHIEKPSDVTQAILKFVSELPARPNKQ